MYKSPSRRESSAPYQITVSSNFTYALYSSPTEESREYVTFTAEHTHTYTHIHTQQDGVRDVLPLQPLQDSPSSQFVSLSSSQLEQFELSQQQQQKGSAQGNSVDHSWGTNDKTGGATDFVSVSEMCHSAEASIEHLPRKRPRPDDFSS